MHNFPSLVPWPLPAFQCNSEREWEHYMHAKHHEHVINNDCGHWNAIGNDL